MHLQIRCLISSLVLAASLVGVPACVSANGSHCANRDGDATCEALGGNARYCSLCVGQDNGCVDAPVEQACRPSDGGTAGGSGDATVADAETTAEATSPSTTTMPTSATASTDPADDTTQGAPQDGGSSDTTPASSEGGDATSDASTTDAPTTDAPTTDMSTTGDPTRGPTTDDDESTSDAPIDPTTGDDGDDDGASTTEPELCGNGALDPSEDCDAAQLGGNTCAALPEFSGGTISCADDCTLDTSECDACLGTLGLCSSNASCCSGVCAGLVVTGTCL